MRSPHLEADPSGEPLSAADVDAFDRGLVEARYLGDPQALASLAARWNGSGAGAARAAAALAARARAVRRRRSRVGPRLAPARRSFAPTSAWPFRDDALRSRHLRARGAVLSALDGLRQAALAFDDPPARFGEVAATVRRWIESQTFSPRRGARGVHLADAQAARFGAFDALHLVGLAEGDWPERPSRNIFYPAFLLSELGWPSQADQQAAVRAAFLDLLTLPREQVSVSTFTLEDDSIVGPSPLVDEIPRARLDVDRIEPPQTLVFVDEALSATPPVEAALSPAASTWLAFVEAGRQPRARSFMAMPAPSTPRSTRSRPSTASCSARSSTSRTRSFGCRRTWKTNRP